MKPVLLLGTLFVLFFYSCTPEKNWVVISSYSDGSTKVLQEYYIDNSDTIYTYQNILGIDGNIQIEGPLELGNRNGLWKSYYPNGTKWSETSFKEGVVDGETKTYYKNGKVRYAGFFKEGEKIGEWNWYDSTGVFIKSVEFNLEDKK